MSVALLAGLCLGLCVGLALFHVAIGAVGVRVVGLRNLRRLSTGLSLAGFAVGLIALVYLVIVWISGAAPPETQWLGLRFDATGAALVAMVTLVGGAVLRFSQNYLDGDARQGAFLGGLHLTLATVILFVLSANLLTFALGWVAMSLTLHKLLVFYPDRPAARLAAHKKFLLARLSDAALLLAFLCLYRITGSLDMADIAARLPAAAPFDVTLVALLLVVAAVLKSAQFPVHGWLIEVMETPTPVSALLHAGVVNAGGVLLLRFSDVLMQSPLAQGLLVLLALGSIIVGSLAMMAQNSVKAALAWSTVAQMGFMLLQCALGAFGAALFHILAHAAYKANAFLSAGTLSDKKPVQERSVAALFPLAALAGLSLTLLATGTLSASLLVTLLAAMGVVTVLEVRRPLILTVVTAGMVALALLGHGVIERLLGETSLSVSPLLATVTVAGMVILCIGQWLALSAPRWPPVMALYVHLKNGFYINTWLNRSAQP
ncbi:proton-conducting transporter membrane subunit [Asticcacaulis sp. W401b]|uniref:proton-conducting transporter transmembrane domain-containing protein n=1 Tax=Asticcacaulis sp. W401b TaxID=3388666 RepID=UPI00397062B0